MGIQSVSQLASSISLPSANTQGSSAAPAAALPAQAQAQPAQTSPTEQSASLKQALKEIETAVQAKANNLQFSVDDSTGKTIVRVIDSSTGDTIRQFPSEEALAIARDIERMQGLLVKDSA